MGVRQRAEFSHMHIYIQGFLPPPLPNICTKNCWLYVPVVLEGHNIVEEG